MVQTPRFCTGCGRPLAQGVAFCTRCGRPVRATPSPGAVPPAGSLGLLRNTYVIEKRLGAGAMGSVYLAHHRELTVKKFAVKEMTFDGGLDRNAADAIARATSEAETLAQLNHPNIPQVFERFEEAGRHFIVMEYVEGIDLEKLVTAHMQVRGTALPEAAVARLAFQIVEALDYLHRRPLPIIHRDIKPANMIVTHSGRVKLVDFGIARATNRRHTQVGTVGYAPKEQYEGLTEPRSDLYSLGATLHHLATGRTPIPFDFPLCRQLNPHLSEGFEAVVANMVYPLADGRPDSARTVWKWLQHLYPHLAVLGPGDADPLLDLITMLRPSGLLTEGSHAPAPYQPQSDVYAPPQPAYQPPQQPYQPSYQAPQQPVPPDAVFCPHCQTPNRSTGWFCIRCSSPLYADQPAQ